MTQYKVKKSLKADTKKFPLNSKEYPTAHKEANKAEKSEYPKGFKKLEKIERHLSHDELLGHSTKSGKIQISEKVPKENRAEVALHEKVENKKIKQLICKKCGKNNCRCK